MIQGGNTIERRAGGELRATGSRLTGYAVVYNAASRDLGGFTEIVWPGAFARALGAGADVLALYHHDTRAVLGRTAAGTLRLRDDARGLGFDLDVAQTTAGRDVLESVGRGDVTGMSFGFVCKCDAWPARDRREIIDADLLEITVTATPAYPDASIARRALALRPWRLALAERELALRRLA